MGLHPPTRGLSLCSGGGGLDMGLHLAEPGYSTACFVEWDEYPRKALIAAQRAGYFKPAPIGSDLTTFDARPWRGIVDTVIAGYPCQPFSAAGKRLGEEDPRHLWPHVARVIQECQPRWVILENVAGHVTLGGEAVLRELHQMGWTPAAGIFSAEEVGAPHERQRLFIVALRRDGTQAGRVKGTSRTGQPSEELADGDSAGPQRIKRRECDAPGRKKPSGHARLRRRTGVFPPGPSDFERWRSVLNMAPDFAPATSLRDTIQIADRCAQMVAAGFMAEAEAKSVVHRMVDGLANRSPQLKLLGNGVVPLCAAHAFRTLATAHGLRPLDMGTADGNSGAGADEPILGGAMT